MNRSFNLASKLYRVLFLLILLASALLAPAVVQAQEGMPETIAYQGYLTNTEGTPANGTTSVTFSLYDNDTGGARVWQETQPNVAFTDGVFSVHLGSVLPLSEVSFDRPLWLGVVVAVGGGGSVALDPRVPFSAVPYAMRVRGLRFVPGQGPNLSPNLIGGHPNNRVEDGVDGAVIGGGGGEEGELGNRILFGGDFATISGGLANTASGSRATVGGGSQNRAGGAHATVAGGQENQATDNFATIGGGNTNEAGSGGTVGGGGANRAGEFSVVAGGSSNSAEAPFAAVGGGISNRALAETATVGGGGQNQADGVGATIPGGQNNQTSGDNSFAAGFNAHAEHDGSFVWASYFDAQDPPFSSTAPRQFLIRAAGGVGIGTNTPRGALHTNNPIVREPDLVVGGASNDPNGIIASDPTLPDSELFLISNRNVGIQLDSNDDQDDQDGANFLIANGDEDLLLILREDGTMTVGNLEATRRVTADTFRADDALGDTDTPEEGGLYQDNLVYAWANVQRDGTVASSYGCTVSKITGFGSYRVTFNRPLPAGVSAIVTVQTLNDPVIATAVADQNKADVSTKVFNGAAFVAADYGFYIQVVGRP